MNIGSVLFSAKGRIGQKTFWMTYGPILVISLALSFVARSDPSNRSMGLLVGLVTLILLYPTICIYSKRLHDMGRSGWLQLVVYGLRIAFGIFVATRTFGATMSAAMSAQGDPEAARAAVQSAVAELTATDPVLKFAPYVGMVISLAWALWLGLTPGNSGANKYGPPEGEEDVRTSVV
jgi:uncharacterized membrane protein YhaH (DUF805 family)